MEWYEIKNIDKVLSPALALYPDRIRHNIEKMIEIAGDASRLRPHIKTYKMPQIVQMQMDRGIKKFKCATIAEAQMLIEAGVEDILLAMPLVGPAMDAFMRLHRAHPSILLAALIDHESQLEKWLEVTKADEYVNLFLDIDVGMHRTGIDPDLALGLINAINSYDRLTFKGLHVYDGHIRTSDPVERKRICDEGFEKVSNLIDKMNHPSMEIVCGGSVTFPIHALYQRRTLSPGTTLLWDYQYGSKFPDIPMQHAAILIARIISLPGADRMCIDLGHKAVASEMQDRRVYFPQLGDYHRVGHSEEHLVLELDDRGDWQVGDVLYGIPTHICPTVALHQEALIVENNKITDRWKVAARHRIYETENV